MNHKLTALRYARCLGVSGVGLLAGSDLLWGIMLTFFMGIMYIPLSEEQLKASQAKVSLPAASGIGINENLCKCIILPAVYRVHGYALVVHVRVMSGICLVIGQWRVDAPDSLDRAKPIKSNIP